MSDNNKVCQHFNLTEVPFRVVKGLEENFSPELHEGFVYFATDTKKIYLDTAQNRLSMGGNTGIHYANSEQPTDGEEFIFSINDMESGEYPNINDLILNTDGCFYKVEEMDKIDGEIKTSKLTIAGSGGGGGPSDAVGKFDFKIPGNTYRSIVLGRPYALEAFFQAENELGEAAEGRYEIRVNDVVKKRDYFKKQGTNIITDFGELFLSEGEYKVKIFCYTDIGYGEVFKSRQITINVSRFALNWEYNTKTLNSILKDFTLNWNLTVDSEQTETYITIDDTHRIRVDNKYTYKILQKDLISYGLTHGAHKFAIQAFALLPGEENMIESDTVIKNILFNDPDSKDYIISCEYFDTLKINQYDTIELPITIYGKNNINNDAIIDFFVNDSFKASSTELANFETYKFSYTPEISNLINLKFQVKNTENYIDIILDVKPLEFPIKEIEGYEFKFKASSFSNNEEIMNWSCDKNNSNKKIIFSQGFDWENGGWRNGSDDVGPYFKIPAGSFITLPYNLFSSDLKATGGNFKIIFKTKNCKDYDATFLNCYKESSVTKPDNSITDTSVGIKLQAQKGVVKMSKPEALEARYYEDTYIEYEFDIDKYNSNDRASQFLSFWIDGVPSGVTNFDATEKMEITPDIDSTTGLDKYYLTLGSDDCDIYIYLIKFYKKHLSTKEHLNNFIADAINSTEMVNRYKRNDIFTVDYKGNEYINPEKLAKANPDCNVFIYSIPEMPTSKNDVSGCTYQQLKGGETVFSDDTVKIRAQGTSSMSYGISAFNIDATFSKPWSVNDTAIPITYANTKVNVASCEGANNALNQEWYNRYQPYKNKKRRESRSDGKIARDTMEFIPGVMFIADKNERKNEANNQKNNLFREVPGYMDLKPDQRYPRLYSIGNMGNAKKNTEVFHGAGNEFECCVENKDNNGAAVQSMTIIQGAWDIEIINEQGNPETTTIPVDLDLPKDNNGNITIFDSNGYVIPEVDWGYTTITQTGEKIPNKDLWEKAMDEYFEFRYKSKSISEEELRNRFLRLVHWFVKNNPSQATNKQFDTEILLPKYTFKGVQATFDASYNKDDEILNSQISIPAKTYIADTPEYRAHKMLFDAENYLIMDSIMYHYLFIERHSMLDNVAKNTFWNTEDGIHWELTKNYDNDTADGINNSGHLALDYGVEALDYEELDGNKTYYFNAPFSAWFWFIGKLPDTVKEYFYGKLYERKAWDANSYINLFNQWQSCIPEACWIEDFNRKYYRPYTEYDDASYLKRLANGKKTHQRNQYEKYQEQYMNSKYKTDALEGANIQWRINQPQGEVDEDGKYSVKANFKMYASGYLNAAVGAGEGGTQTAVNVHKRGKKGQVIVFEHSQGNTNYGDGTNYIYSPNLYSEITEIEKLYPQYFEAANGNKIRKIQWNAKTSAQKNSLKGNVSFGQNIEEIEILNCSSATTSLNLSNCQRLKRLDTSGSGFGSYNIATGAPLEYFKVEMPTGLIMSKLKYLTEDNFNIANYGALTTIFLNDIDNGTPKESNKISINSKTIVDNIYKAGVQTADLTYDLQKVQWQFSEQDNITDTNIPILDYLLNSKTQVLTDEQNKEYSKSKSLALTGKGIIPHTAYSNGKELDLYNKYGLLTTNDSSYPNFLLDFKDLDNKNKLLTLNIKNGAGKIVWSRQFNTFENIDNTVLLQSMYGAFDADEAIKKEDSNTETFRFLNKWQYLASNGEYKEIYGHSNDYQYLDLTLIRDITYDITIEPVYDIDDRTYSVKIFNIWNDNPIYEVNGLPYEADFEQVRPKILPIKDDSDLYDITKTYKLIGYTSIKYKEGEKPSVINEKSWRLRQDNLALYTVYEEDSVYNIDYSPYLNILGDTVNGLKKYNGQYIYQGTKLVIPKEIVEIGSQAFGKYDAGNEDNRTNLKAVFVAPNSQLNTISARAFAESKLEYFEFTNSIQTINQYAFRSCNLQSINYRNTLILPQSLKIIGNQAFNSSFGSLKQNQELTIIVPASVTSMGKFAIAHLGSVKANIYIGSNTEFSNLILDNIDNIPIISSNGDGTYDICNIYFYTNKYTAQSEIDNKSIREFFDDVLLEKPGNINVSYIN